MTLYDCNCLVKSPSSLCFLASGAVETKGQTTGDLRVEIEGVQGNIVGTSLVFLLPLKWRLHIFV